MLPLVRSHPTCTHKYHMPCSPSQTHSHRPKVTKGCPFCAYFLLHLTQWLADDSLPGEVLLRLAAAPTISIAREETRSSQRRSLNVCSLISVIWSRRLTASSDDLATASAKVKGDLPGREKEAKKAGEEGFEAVRAKAQNLVGLLDAPGGDAPRCWCWLVADNDP